MDRDPIINTGIEISIPDTVSDFTRDTLESVNRFLGGELGPQEYRETPLGDYEAAIITFEQIGVPREKSIVSLKVSNTSGNTIYKATYATRIPGTYIVESHVSYGSAPNGIGRRLSERYMRRNGADLDAIFRKDL